MNKDLTVGSPSKILWRFCLPLFGSIIFQQLYNVADSLVAGKFVSENALAAVGNGYEITLIFIAFAFGCNIGCSVITANYFGARRYADMRTAVHTTLIASAVLCAILMIIGWTQCRNLLRLINTPDEIMDDSLLYLNIYILGLPFLFFYNVATGIFSALGDSRTPFIFLAISSTSNIAMDIFFVTAFKMGVAGVAWATFICQSISCIFSIIIVLRRIAKIRSDEDEGESKLFSLPILGKISAIAIPSILQQSFISVGNIVIQGVINGFGTSVMAGYSAAVKLNNLVITSLTTLGNGVSNYTAQNLGAGKRERIKPGFFAAGKLVWIICIPFIIIYCTAGRYLLLLFMEQTSTEAIGKGMQFLRIISPFYLVVSIKLVADGVLRGAGKMGRFMVATFTDLILRVLLAVFLSKVFGTTGIWSAWPIGWCIATIISVIFFFKGEWNKKTPPDSKNPAS